MKVVFNKRLVKGPWGGGNQMLLLLQNYLNRRGHTVSYQLEDDADLVVIMDVKDGSCAFPMSKLHKFKEKTGVKVVHRVNDNGSHRKQDTTRKDDRMIAVNRNLADKTIFISKWLQDYYEDRGLFVEDAAVIVNGTDRGRFYPVEKAKRKEKDPISIVTHHWSTNESKGYSIYDALDKFCNENSNIATFTFMGNCPEGCLRTATKIPPKTYVEIPQYLMVHDVYITATQFESGGCHIVEGMSCGLIPLVRVGGGGTEEYAKDYGLFYKGFDELSAHIRNLQGDYAYFQRMQANVRDNYTYGSKEMCEAYMKVFEDALSS